MNSLTMGALHLLRRHPAHTDPDRHVFILRLIPPSTDVDVDTMVVDVAVVKMVVVVDVVDLYPSGHRVDPALRQDSQCLIPATTVSVSLLIKFARLGRLGLRFPLARAP